MSDLPTSSKPGLAILTNVIPPYRLPIYEYLSSSFEIKVYYSGDEANRQWSVQRVPGVEFSKSWGFSFSWPQRGKSGAVTDIRFLHVNPGYLWNLITDRPDAVISTEMGFRSIIALTFGKLYRKPVWIWWGGTIHSERNRSTFKRLIRTRFFRRSVKRWISYGSSSTVYLQSLGVPADRILQVQNAVDDRTFHDRARPADLGLPHPRILVVGQLIGRKGLDLLLDSIEVLQKQNFSLSLILVGDGPERNRVLARAGAIRGLSVKHLGHVPTEEMPGIYRACDLLVFPTLEDVWGLVVNEAILCGLPVLASTYAGCAEELLPRECVFDPYDTRDLAMRIQKMLHGDLPAQDMGRVLPARKVAQLIEDDINAHLACS